MRKQQQIWLDEHTNKGTLPTMANVEPASGVVHFTNWLKEHDVKTISTAVDIGAGKGCNSVRLAKLGFEVWALGYIRAALDTAKGLAKANEVADRIHFELTEVDKAWRIKDNSFNIAVDSFSSIDIETHEGREVCRDEMYRTLKPDGYGLITVCSAEDEWEKELITNHPGPEPNSTLWPQNGKFQKDYTETELKDFYKMFRVVELRVIQKPAFKLGRDRTATNLWLVVQK
jgi:cyclopropane fatty-acyl-phospholipid synthase-like methyltransferase